MMRELIELAIENDAMLVLKRTRYIMDKIRAASECALGTSLDEGDVQLLYITGNAKKLTEMEQYYVLMFKDKFRIEFTAEVLRLVMSHGAETEEKHEKDANKGKRRQSPSYPACVTENAPKSRAVVQGGQLPQRK